MAPLVVEACHKNRSIPDVERASDASFLPTIGEMLASDCFSRRWRPARKTSANGLSTEQFIAAGTEQRNIAGQVHTHAVFDRRRQLGASSIGSESRFNVALQKYFWRASLPIESNTRWPGMTCSIPATAVSGAGMKPFQAIDAAAIGLSRGLLSSRQARIAQTSDTKSSDHPPSGSARRYGR